MAQKYLYCAYCDSLTGMYRYPIGYEVELVTDSVQRQIDYTEYKFHHSALAMWMGNKLILENDTRG